MAEFTLVTVLLVILVLGIAQFALAVHVRNTLVACAAEGARLAANADRGPAEGVAHARSLIADSLSPRFATQVSGGYVTVDGVGMVRVDVQAPLPLVGLAGPSRQLQVSGHAVAEQL